MLKKYDIKTYNKILADDLSYQKMIKQMASVVKGEVLEVGAGTGLLTKNILRNKKISTLKVIEKDKIFIGELRRQFPDLSISQRNVLYKKDRNKYDFIVMSLVFHHVKDNLKIEFLKNLQNDLKPNSILLIGDIFIPDYKNEKERDLSLKKFHNYCIKHAKSLAAKEDQKRVLKYGLERKGEYKICRRIARNIFKKVNLKIIREENIDSQKSGGYSIFFLQKGHTIHQR